MKLIKLVLFASAAVGQKKRPNYGGVRPQNPNQYPNKRPTKKPVTKKPVYTTRPPIYGGQGGGQNGAGNQNGNFGAGGQGSGFGDPHFMVSCPGQDPICFDYNPPAGSEMTLVMDPETGLHISARVDGRRQGRTRFMTRLHISSPLGGQLTINEHGVAVDGLPSWVGQNTDESKDEIEYGDIKYTEIWSEDGTRDKITVQIEDGPSFLIKEKALRETISFGITNTHGLSEKTRGVIGQFVKPNAYIISKDEKNMGTVTIDDFEVPAIWDDFHRNTQCWTIEEDDLTPLFELSK